MNSSEFTQRKEESKGFKGSLLIGVALAVIAVTALIIVGIYLKIIPFIDIVPIETEPPPIIIKSGSFIIETEGDFDVSPGNNPPFIFKKNGFAIRKIRVFTYNELSGRAYDAQDFNNSEVRVWFQEFNLITKQWMPLSTLPDIVIKGGISDFELSKNTGKKLKKMNKSNKKRQIKYEDEEHPKVFRFGKIEIGDSIPIIPSDGDEYFIGFYKVP